MPWNRGGRQVTEEEWEDWNEGFVEPTALGQQTSGHHETWNTQQNGLWQSLREAGEAYRKAHGIKDALVARTKVNVEDLSEIAHGMVVGYEPSLVAENSNGMKQMEVKILTRKIRDDRPIRVQCLETGKEMYVRRDTLKSLPGQYF